MLKLYETLIFIMGWTVIMLLGADFPPPFGFWKVITGILIIAIIQWRYMNWMLPHIRSIKSLAVTVVLFTALGAVAAVITALTSEQGINDQFMIWVAVITTIGALYGFAFWGINRLISHRNS